MAASRVRLVELFEEGNIRVYHVQPTTMPGARPEGGRLFVYFQWIDDQFICGGPECEGEDVECIWYRYDGIDWGVDRTFGECYCRDCGKYIVEYQRDSS